MPDADLFVLGSGSKGNAFVLRYCGATLLLDVGFSAREVERRMEVAGLDPASLVGLALTHEHGDHASGATRLARRHDIPLLASFGTWHALARGGEPCGFLPIGSTTAVDVGPFAVRASPTSHDAAEPVALGVTLPGGVSIGVAYDLGRPTQSVRWFLRDRTCLVLEANHDELLLRRSGYPPVVQQRIAGSGGHLSNLDAARLLEDVHHEALATVVVAHMSLRCNTVEAARNVILPALAARGFRGGLIFAEQDGPMAAIPLHPPHQATLFG